MMLIEKIKTAANKISGEVIANRRHLHKFPELSFREKETSAFIKSKLEQLGIAWIGMAVNGVVGIVKGNLNGDKTIALRADIDALPIAEQNNVSYASQNTGVMHACGHDVHTASLLGVAAILNNMKDDFGGMVKLIFQPAEEVLPGGASAMIQQGVLDDPDVCVVIGQHVMPSLEAGQIGIRKGKFMASMDELYITIQGKGGHGAQPHLNIDPVLISSHIIIALQQMVSRLAPPDVPTVLSFGRVIANGAVNVIPDEVYMEGTFRTMDERWRKDAHEKMIKMAATLASGMGAFCNFNIKCGYPVLINDEKITGQIRDFAEDFLGEHQVKETDMWMAAEDFAYYAERKSACFYLLGVGSHAKRINLSLHTPTFNIDECALESSTGLMAYIALKLLEN